MEATFRFTTTVKGPPESSANAAIKALLGELGKPVWSYWTRIRDIDVDSYAVSVDQRTEYWTASAEVECTSERRSE